MRWKSCTVRRLGTMAIACMWRWGLWSSWMVAAHCKGRCKRSSSTTVPLKESESKQSQSAPGAARSVRSGSTAPLYTSADSGLPQSTTAQTAQAVLARMSRCVRPRACLLPPSDDRPRDGLWVVSVVVRADKGAPRRRRSGQAVPGSARPLVGGRRRVVLAARDAADDSAAPAPDAGGATVTSRVLWPAGPVGRLPGAVSAGPLAYSRRSLPPGWHFFPRLAGLVLQHHQGRIG